MFYLFKILTIFSDYLGGGGISLPSPPLAKLATKWFSVIEQLYSPFCLSITHCPYVLHFALCLAVHSAGTFVFAPELKKTVFFKNHNNLLCCGLRTSVGTYVILLNHF